MSLISCFHGPYLSWILLLALAVVFVRPGNATGLTDLFPTIPFDKGFSEVYGGENLQLTNNGNSVNIMLNKQSGSGFVSKGKYNYGFFSTKLKLPSGYSAGVVVAFYMSNADEYPQNHDEIDFELLGHDGGGEWLLQTNLYGDGSVSTGREERFRFWFDPTQSFHSYTIIWNEHHTVYLVDDIPIREVIHNQATSKVYPSKPMSLYATIWDGSNWATHGGKSPVDYRYEPFVASFTGMEVAGCLSTINPVSHACSTSVQGANGGVDPVIGQEFIALSAQQKARLAWARKNFMTYSYCTDRNRYPVPLPECN